MNRVPIEIVIVVRVTIGVNGSASKTGETYRFGANVATSDEIVKVRRDADGPKNRRYMRNVSTVRQRRRMRRRIEANVFDR